MADEQDEWNRLVRDGLTTEGDTNTRFPFQGMSRKFGRAWIEYCQVAWAANDGCLTEEEFCRINGGIPAKFFAAKIKEHHLQNLDGRRPSR